MADYTPVFMRREIPMTCSAAITGGAPVAVSGDGTVAQAATDDLATVVGVALHDTSLSGQRVTVCSRGPVHVTTAAGGITAGQQVSSSATAGRVKALAASAIDIGATLDQPADNNAINGAINAARAVLGVALTTATNGNPVRWMQF